ncbi:hypothetical protein FB451DRAFT_1358732 [Mycena latifolia]|nr:hypothetical protein FB451DRAFT_1358732 [Mycena latifolia]
MAPAKETEVVNIQTLTANINGGQSGPGGSGAVAGPSGNAEGPSVVVKPDQLHVGSVHLSMNVSDFLSGRFPGMGGDKFLRTSGLLDLSEGDLISHHDVFDWLSPEPPDDGTLDKLVQWLVRWLNIFLDKILRMAVGHHAFSSSASVTEAQNSV